MKGLVCEVCGYVAIDGVAPDHCPICMAASTAFKPKDDALKTAANIATSGESEKKHVPSITVSKKCGLIPDGCTDVHIKIGEIQHPMLPEHFITRIVFYIDKKYAGHVCLTPALNPASSVHVKAKGAKFAAVETCNVHGSWFNEVDL